MSNLIEEKLKSSVRTSLNNKIKDHKLRTALDYLNQISFTVDGTSNKTIDLLSNDAICLLGNSRMTNLMLTRLTVHCLMPKKYGGFRISKAFILDAGNCTDVYQFVDFMKQYGLNIKRNLNKIMISRVFTVYQLTHFLKYELPKTVHDYKINIVIIPDLLTMFFQESERDFNEVFFQESERDFNEVKFLLTDILNILKTITRDGKFLLITSLSLDNELPPFVIELGNMITQCFNKCIVIDKNKTNNKYKIVIQQKQDADYITIKGHMSLTPEDVLTVKVR